MQSLREGNYSAREGVMQPPEKRARREARIVIARILLGSLFFCVAGTLLVGPSSGATPPISASWAEDRVWDDGLAEVAMYEASRPIYGAPRSYEAILLTVKEDFDAEKLIKANTPFGQRAIVTVLKQNAVREIATPNYDYRIMTSTFVERDDPTRLVKLTSGSHEWCGNTWKAIRSRDGRLVYDWSSYIDGEGDGAQLLDVGPGDLLEDQLPLVLRGLEFREGLAFEFRMLPGMANTHAGPGGWIPASLRIAGRETVELPVGSIDAWRVEIVAAGRTASYWFDVDGTHPLVQAEVPGADSLRLKKIERRAYWRLR